MLLILNPGMAVNILICVQNQNPTIKIKASVRGSRRCSAHEHKSHSWFQHSWSVNARECSRPGLFVAEQKHGGGTTVKQIDRERMPKSVQCQVPLINTIKQNQNKGFCWGMEKRPSEQRLCCVALKVEKKVRTHISSSLSASRMQPFCEMLDSPVSCLDLSFLLQKPGKLD